MIKFSMHCFDVLFPINLGPLTYSCPASLAEILQPGQVVQAPLKNRMTRGIILGSNISPPDGPLKELQTVPGEPAVISTSLLTLIKWMSEYYIALEGLVLKQTLPGELFTRTKPRKAAKDTSSPEVIDFMDISREDALDIATAIQSKSYSCFLLHAPSLLYEYSMVSQLLHGGRNIIVLVPDIGQANILYNALRDRYAERLCLLHGELPRGKRSDSIEGILSGRLDIVIGTRPALFAPLKNVSLVMVLNEHSPLYKVEEGIRFNIRDVAVMRGFIEKAAVLLSSVSPSIDSYFNAVTEKYRMIKPVPADKRPVIRIADMQFEKKIKPGLSKTAYDAANRHIRKNHKVLFVVNRRGYSTLLLCNECAYIMKCRRCDIPLVLHKNDHMLKCHYCNKTESVPERCPRCKSHNFSLQGSGTERIQEYIEELFGKATMRFDSDNVKKKSEKEEASRLISGDYARILIGTKMMTSLISIADKYALAAVLNIDSSLNLPDFRAMEKAYHELSSIIGLVEPTGEVVIQTRHSGIPFFQHLRHNDYAAFAREELSLRKSLGYPPYAKLLKVTFSGASNTAEKIVRIIHDTETQIDLLGPTKDKNRKGTETFSIILKSPDRKALNTAARKVLKTFERSKNQIRIEVDPAS
jgi:primosomal protein N' (replication factor Y)